MKNINICLLGVIGVIECHSMAMADCAGLSTQRFTDTEIIKAESIAAGAFNPPTDALLAAAKELPALCRIVGVIRPTADSAIGFELWLPEAWNGRYLQVGNGGFAGAINYGGLLAGLRDGFAVASTDDGHTSTGAEWALGHPEKLIDYGHRAVHLTSVVGKKMVSTHYRREASRSYFNGCSDGGREGLMEAQRYPDDFDGWIIGAPSNDWTGVMTYLLYLAQSAAAMKEPLQPAQMEALTKGALSRCDRTDGVVDGVIDQPLSCDFDPAELECKGASDGRCLTRVQVESVRKIYDGGRDAKTQARLTPGFKGVFGDEVHQWPIWIGPQAEGSGYSPSFFPENFWPFMVYDDPKLDFRTLDLRQAAIDGRSRTGAILNAMDPDLSTVRAAGKKIIQYHGWADGIVPAQVSTAYYDAVRGYLGGDIRDFYRLFMVPGMGHCAGGPGPSTLGTAADPRPLHIGLLASLQRWVEEGQAPDQIVATKYRDDDAKKGLVRTRPLCPYPSVARWTGKGSTEAAKNFICSPPAQQRNR